jgi:hypothetical protein
LPTRNYGHWPAQRPDNPNQKKWQPDPAKEISNNKGVLERIGVFASNVPIQRIPNFMFEIIIHVAKAEK